MSKATVTMLNPETQTIRNDVLFDDYHKASLLIRDLNATNSSEFHLFVFLFKSSYRSYKRFQHINEAKGSFSIVLTL